MTETGKAAELTLKELAELGEATARQIAILAVNKGDSESVSSCYGYIHRDLQSLEKWGEASMSPGKVWRLNLSGVDALGA